MKILANCLGILAALSGVCWLFGMIFKTGKEIIDDLRNKKRWKEKRDELRKIIILVRS